MARELGLASSSSTEILVDIDDDAAPKSLIVPEQTPDNSPSTEADHDIRI
jgi:hypothetical protein